MSLTSTKLGGHPAAALKLFAINGLRVTSCAAALWLVAGCDTTPRKVYVPTPVPCIAAADVPKRPPLFSDAELAAMTDYQLPIAINIDRKALTRYADDAGVKLAGCASLK
jgi:hypothetical protein